MKPNTIKDLSIQIRLSGLSFCILNRTTNTIERLQHIQLEKKATPFELLNQLKTIIESNADFNQVFDSVLCIYQNELSTLVPNSLFNDNHLADYLKFNAKILKTDFIDYDTISLNNSVNVYVPLVNVNNYLFDTFGSFIYKHASTILISSVLQHASKHKDIELYVNVGNLHFEMLAAKDNDLKFYNTFDYITKEDFIYYILFSIEQLQLNPETVKIHLSGQIDKDDDLFKIVYKYVRFVDFLEPIHSYQFSTKKQPKGKHTNFILLNSFN
ncbi:DUF3822 family protein [Psychroserpens ponticola]|uniref:DUF3822 family protein n=1 Tax=Psychroserpens ponticola TaxID=2932268 RepID=A0ABY7S171_9FLAO|nr:DUF3822 family protein [Psychroserpens ponticola]WCO03072.1 DUF3822 family protein [Psychroserpens ponticola]